MRRRVIGAAALALAVGVGGGAAAAYVVQPHESPDGMPVPVPAQSPSVPFLTTPPPLVVQDDLDTPAMAAPTHYTRLEVGNSLQSWSIVKPAGWQAYCTTPGQSQEPISDAKVATCTDSGVYFRPVDEPSIGGYSLRVQTISNHLTAAETSAAKISAIEGSDAYAQVTVLPGSTDAAVYLTLLAQRSGVAAYLLRHNFFRWFTAPATPGGTPEVTLEMSVTGRERDDAALRALFSAFAARTRPLPSPS